MLTAHSGPWWSRPAWWWCTLVVSSITGAAMLVATIVTGSPAIPYVFASAVWSPFGLLIWRKRPEHPMGPLLSLVGLLSLSVVPGFLMGGFFEQFPAVVEPRPTDVSIARDMTHNGNSRAWPPGSASGPVSKT